MADIKLSTIVGGGSSTFMMETISGTGIISIKDGASTERFDNQAAFYTAINLDHTEQGYTSSSFTTALNTTEQTILDKPSENGVLTHVLAPVMSNIGDTTIVRVTADGKVFTFTSKATIATFRRYMVGDFRWYNASTSATQAPVDLGFFDDGYDALPQPSMTTPHQALMNNIGIPFSASIKVTVQLSAAGSGASLGANATVAYLNYTPQRFL